MGTHKEQLRHLSFSLSFSAFVFVFPLREQTKMNKRSNGRQSQRKEMFRCRTNKNLNESRNLLHGSTVSRWWWSCDILTEREISQWISFGGGKREYFYHLTWNILAASSQHFRFFFLLLHSSSLFSHQVQCFFRCRSVFFLIVRKGWMMSQNSLCNRLLCAECVVRWSFLLRLESPTAWKISCQWK